MRREIAKDYAECAFQYYASIGKPSYDSLKNKYIDNALEEYKKAYNQKVSVDNLDNNIKLKKFIDSALKSKKGELEDVLAIEKTLVLLNDAEKICVDAIYFSNEKLTTVTKSNLIKELYLSSSLTEKDIHGNLRKARILFAYERGLRIL